MKKDLGHLRKNYTVNALDETNIPDMPLELFSAWFDEVTQQGGIEEVNAMTLSTIDVKGEIRGRVVLLKDLSEDGFVFYSNYESAKCQALFTHPKVSLSFFWPNLERQVIVSGIAEKVSDDISDAYFSSRPRGSQLGAHVSPQSQPIDSRGILAERLALLTKKFEGKDIPRPSHWGGIVVKPQRIEFWQGRPNRLHDRFMYTKEDDTSWSRKRLAP